VGKTKAITLQAGATLSDAAKLLVDHLCPVFLLADEQGGLIALLREEDLRIGLAEKARPHHKALSLAVPPEVYGLHEGQKVSEIEGSVLGLPSIPKVNRALLMAGGLGSRLAPLTDHCPKPLLPIKGKPLLHRLLEQVQAAGIQRVFLSILYLGDMVRESIGDGSAFGLEIQYLEETHPLGTAGALGLLPEEKSPLLVMNGDILSTINLPSLFAWHGRNKNKVTVATWLHQVHVPFGLAHFEGQKLLHIEEKPTLRLPVNAGIYLFEPELVQGISKGKPRDMVGWLNELAQGGEVGQFPIVENWEDIGSLEAYERLR
jgi:dTDP-glucose pyrophosphorylase